MIRHRGGARCVRQARRRPAPSRTSRSCDRSLGRLVTRSSCFSERRCARDDHEVPMRPARFVRFPLLVLLASTATFGACAAITGADGLDPYGTEGTGGSDAGTTTGGDDAGSPTTTGSGTTTSTGTPPVL